MKRMDLKIRGMSCHHCVMAVRAELEKIGDVKVDEVIVGGAKVRYDESKVSPAQLEEAVKRAGYEPVAGS